MSNLACTYCFRRKIKCTDKHELLGCINCRKRGIECCPRERTSLISKQVVHIQPPNWIHHMLALYFTHERERSAIHEGLFYKSLRKHKVEPGLVFAMISCAAEYDTTLSVESQAACKRVMLHRARDALNLNELSMETVQAMLIMLPLELTIGTQNNMSDALLMLTGTATRTCLAMGVHRMDAMGIDTSPEAETMRRLFWTCYCHDRVQGMHGIPHAIRDEDCTIRLPVEHEAWTKATKKETPPMFDSLSLLYKGWPAGYQTSLFGTILHLFTIVGRISDFRFRQKHLDATKSLAVYISLMQGLGLWWQTLPLEYTPRTVMSDVLSHVHMVYYSAFIYLYLHGSTCGIKDEQAQVRVNEYADRIWQITMSDEPTSRQPNTIAKVLHTACLLRLQQTSHPVNSPQYLKLDNQLDELTLFQQTLPHHCIQVLHKIRSMPRH
jgi:hypothetical protein